MTTLPAPAAPSPVSSWMDEPLIAGLQRRVHGQLAGLASGDEPASRAVRQLLAAGGKRLRPMLVHMGGQLAGASADDLDGLALAGELVHVASLLHDDLMDGAHERRGRPTAWRSLGPKAAVLGGDLAHVLALERVQRAPAPVSRRFIQTIGAMVSAQSLEIQRLGHLQGGVEAWRQVAHGKTAALCGWCAEVGGLVAGEREVATALRRFGECLGLAFQAVDDLLDLVPGMDPGKPPFADLRTGVPSLPLRLAARRDPRWRQAVLSLWRHGGEPGTALGDALLRAGGPATVAYIQGELSVAHQILRGVPQRPARRVLEAMLQGLSLRANACLLSISDTLEV